MKQTILSFLMMSFPLITNAETVEIDGIYYNLISKSKSAEVTHKPSGYYSGEIVIPEKVTFGSTDYPVSSIGENAFYCCQDLTSITIPKSVTFIGQDAFDTCIKLSKVNISDLDAWCNIKFSNNPLRYAHHLYINGNEIKDLEIPNTVSSISFSAFSGCTELTSVIIPSSVTSIGNSAFGGCSSLTSLSIGTNVTSIGNFAFSGCSALVSVTIPNSVTSIGWGVFSYCNSLSSINVDNDNKQYDSRNECNAIIETHSNTILTGCKSTIIPNSVTAIGYSAFEGCSGLVSITIPNNVITISDQAFSECSNLTTIIIGNGVKYFDSYPFYNCQELTDVYCLIEDIYSTNYFGSGARYTYEAAFMESKVEYATLHVPETAIDAYKTTAPWRDFGKIVALTEDDPIPSGIDRQTIYNSAYPVDYYTSDGITLSKPKRGLNIIKMTNGTTKKIMKR